MVATSCMRQKFGPLMDVARFRSAAMHFCESCLLAKYIYCHELTRTVRAHVTIASHFNIRCSKNNAFVCYRNEQYIWSLRAATLTSSSSYCFFICRPRRVHGIVYFPRSVGELLQQTERHITDVVRNEMRKSTVKLCHSFCHVTYNKREIRRDFH
jgi:hypothetical protein